MVPICSNQSDRLVFFSKRNFPILTTGRGVDGAGGEGGGGDHSGAGHHGGARGWLLAGARPHGFGGQRSGYQSS